MLDDYLETCICLAIKSDSPESDLRIANILLEINTPVSLSYAVELFEISAKTGSTQAMKKLSLCYRQGLGVEQNTFLADYWLEESQTTGELGNRG